MKRFALACLFVVGCAAETPHARFAPPAPVRVQPAPEPVRLVSKRPAGAQFVGVVVGTATTIEIVDAAKDARAELMRKAKALGADVVKVERVTPPPAHGPARRRVLLAGRAYKTSLRTESFAQ